MVLFLMVLLLFDDSYLEVFEDIWKNLEVFRGIWRYLKVYRSM